MTSDRVPDDAFAPGAVMGLNIRNRFIRSATLEMMAASDGAPTPELTSLYAGLASGGAGLISTSACLTDRAWLPRPGRFLTLDSDDRLGLWEETVQAVHRAGALLSLQLGLFSMWAANRRAPRP